MTGSNKELLIIPGASHVDLYDDVAGVIPYDKIEQFFVPPGHVRMREGSPPCGRLPSLTRRTITADSRRWGRWDGLCPL